MPSENTAPTIRRSADRLSGIAPSFIYEGSLNPKIHPCLALRGKMCIDRKEAVPNGLAPYRSNVVSTRPHISALLRLVHEAKSQSWGPLQTGHRVQHGRSVVRRYNQNVLTSGFNTSGRPSDKTCFRAHGTKMMFLLESYCQVGLRPPQRRMNLSSPTRCLSEMYPRPEPLKCLMNEA